MTGYPTATGYFGYVDGTYMLFATEQDYKEYYKEHYEEQKVLETNQK